MREFKDDLGNIVDLDDPKTYERLPSDTKELDKLMFSEIGITLCYMNIWYTDIFGKRDGEKEES